MKNLIPAFRRSAEGFLLGICLGLMVMAMIGTIYGSWIAHPFWGGCVCAGWYVLWAAVYNEMVEEDK